VREKILLGNLLNHFILDRLVVNELPFANERRAGARTDPHDHGAAALDSSSLPALWARVDQDLVPEVSDEPHGYRPALISVFPDRGKIDVARGAQRFDVAPRSGGVRQAWLRGGRGDEEGELQTELPSIEKS